MRRGLLLFIIANLIVFGIIINYLFTLITLLFEDCSADAIHPADLPAPNSEVNVGINRPQYIPKILHQTWMNETIPEKWRVPQQSCLDLHKDWEYKLWTNEKSRDFIAKEYPWFLETFDNYPYPIMRADAIRYFVLATYGGIYLDLDDGCQRPLDPLLSYRAWLRKTVPTGISNDAMGSAPQHPFFLRVIQNLQKYSRNWQVPYVTVMYSTGPLFLSVIWKEYMAEAKTDDEKRVRILMPDEYNKKPWAFFGVYKGSSWHQGDAKTIFWLGQHWLLVTVLVIFLAVSLYTCGFCLYRRISARRSPRARGYSPVATASVWPWRRRSSGSRDMVEASHKRYDQDEV
ncbi:hypothetical protein EX30DRAFT_148482 [Ascodesmis nigricans]|uniref:Mannosyl phosphorylinositol ceramide synthase SUR1 n=1 Tax=Ascodesmis nigricans TaxID=341454 RepID=A0A4S2N1Y8_9PEZI|nr:hypothetical protein EX30DRAFT_148482 [Ascodesmis nigricans]